MKTLTTHEEIVVTLESLENISTNSLRLNFEVNDDELFTTWSKKGGVTNAVAKNLFVALSDYFFTYGAVFEPKEITCNQYGNIRIRDDRALVIINKINTLNSDELFTTIVSKLCKGCVLSIVDEKAND